MKLILLILIIQNGRLLLALNCKNNGSLVSNVVLFKDKLSFDFLIKDWNFLLLFRNVNARADSSDPNASSSTRAV